MTHIVLLSLCECVSAVMTSTTVLRSQQYLLIEESRAGGSYELVIVLDTSKIYDTLNINYKWCMILIL